MRRALLATLVAGLVAAGLLVRRGDEPTRARHAPADVPAQETRVASPRSASSGGRPRSLRGTTVDGGLAVDAAGRFVPTLEARRLFDYFLTAGGELSVERLRARIVREIERRLPPDAVRDATALLDRYLAYRERVRLLATEGSADEHDLDTRLATLIALRREVLGDAAEAFFAAEEAEARRLLEARRIVDDPTLTAEERRERVEALYAESEAALPAEIREARATARLATALRAMEEEIRADGGEEADVQALRERLAGPEAAARLADLDRRRADWQGRVDAFRTARDRLERDGSLSADARAAAVDQLLADSFTPAERLRIEALDRIAAETRDRVE